MKAMTDIDKRAESIAQQYKREYSPGVTSLEECRQAAEAAILKQIEISTVECVIALIDETEKQRRAIIARAKRWAAEQNFTVSVQMDLIKTLEKRDEEGY